MSTQKLVGENALSAIATDIKTALGTKANASDLATVATSGSYNDLSNKPSIPTKVSDLTNDSDFQTGDEVDASIATAIANKADIDGEYDLMVVGNAKQLKSNVGENDKAPYLFRTSGGSIDIGDRETDKLVGGTVAFNQLVQNGNFESTTGWGTNNYTQVANNNTMEITKIGDGYALYKVISIPLNHKVLKTLTIKGISGITYYFNGQFPNYTGSGDWEVLSRIVINNETDNYFNFKTNEVGDYQTAYVKNFMYIDITAMFGSTIADYIYELENNNAGDGVAFFRKLFPKSYYAYNAGELVSVKTTKHITRGFNAWDELTELGILENDGSISPSTVRLVTKNYIPIVGGLTYSMRIPYAIRGRGAFYDENKNLISYFGDFPQTGTEAVFPNNGALYPTVNGYYFKFNVPINARYMKYNMVTAYGTTYKHDICINLSWDGERDGEYEPYVEHEYPLDSDLELRGIPKLDANNKLYYDGDTYESNGSVTRKYGIVDLGNLNWTYYQQYNSFIASISDLYLEDNTDYSRGLVCNIYSVVNYWWTESSKPDKTISHAANNYIAIKDSSYNDAPTFKTAMSGKYLVYELATLTTETADEYQNPQIVDDFGTEEYVDTRAVAIPVGHDTFYQANLRAKLEMSPDSPSGNGDYIVRQTDGQNEYVALTKELPTLPSADGTYTLKCTVSSGTASLSWVAD